MKEVQVEDLLSAIRDDLRRGEYGRLARHTVDLEQAIAGLDALPKPALDRIRHVADGNAACLAAALQGFQAARRRLAEIAKADRGEAYDAHGRRHALGAADRRLRIGSNSADFADGDQERLNPRRV